MQETLRVLVQSLGPEDPLEEGTAVHSSILAWRIPWSEEPGRLQSMWSQRVGHDWGTNHNTAHSPFIYSPPHPRVRGLPSYPSHGWKHHSTKKWLKSQSWEMNGLGIKPNLPSSRLPTPTHTVKYWPWKYLSDLLRETEDSESIALRDTSYAV